MATNYKIERGIAAPPSGRANKYPFAEMEIGDSFLVDPGKRQSVSNLIVYQANRHGRKFITRTVEGGVRVWRIA